MTPAPRLSPVSFDTLLVSVGVNRLLAALEVNAPLPLWFEELEQIYNLVSTEDWLSLREQYNQLLARQEEARTLGDAKLQEQLDLEAVKAWLNLMYLHSRRNTFLRRWWEESPQGLSSDEYTSLYATSLHPLLEPLSAEDTAFYRELGLSFRGVPARAPRLVQSSKCRAMETAEGPTSTQDSK